MKYFLIEDDDLVEKYNTMWDKFSTGIRKELDSKPVYNNFFFKTKIKFYSDEVTDFFNKEIPKADSYLISSNQLLFCS